MAKIIDSNTIDRKKDFFTNCQVITCVDHNSTGTKTMTMGRTILEPGAKNRHHTHACDVSQYVAKGTIRFFVGPNKEEHTLKQGMFLYLSPREPHSFENLSENEKAEVIFNYANVPSMEAADTQFLE